MAGCLAALFALLPLLPAALAFTPTARWGHDAVYLPHMNAMYVIGGQVLSPGVQVTNDVLVYQLNGTNPSWSVGPSANLPPHAFAATAATPDGNGVVVVGGMTSNCASDTIAHTLDIHGDGIWQNSNPAGLVRRRGAAMGVMKGSNQLMVVGGVADQYSCASYTSTFPATDMLSLPLTNSSVDSTKDLPSDLTGSSLAVSDFAMTTSANGESMYLLSGQTSSGALVGLDNIGVWTQSGGWKSQKVGGSIPVGRVGASLVAHPALDMLVLHGGARDDSGSDLSTSLLAFLNTTSWQWTIPANLQPPQSSAASYHSAVMTPSGVMITAFGMSGTGSPRSDMYFLDMRDPSASTWSWKSSWNSAMLSSYIAPATGSTSTSGGSLPINASMGASPRKLASIVAPVVILSAIAIPLIIYFVRRKMRIAKKRRMARHFSFSAQDDGGEFRSAKKGTTRYPFGPDGEKESSSLLGEFKQHVSGVVDRFRRGSGGGAGRGKKERFNEKSMKWEEIDFGLGEVDSRRGSTNFQSSSRRSSFSDSPPAMTGRYVDSVPMPVPMPMASGVAYHGQTYNLPSADMPMPLLVTISGPDSPRHGTPQWDGQQPLIPSLVVLPPTNPSTPAVSASAMPEPVYPATPPAEAAKDDGLDWNMLQQELDNRPAFRSISPTSPLRSHQQSHQAPSTPPRINTQFAAGNPFSDRASPRSASPSSPAPALPYLDFQAPARPQSPSITLVNSAGRRTSSGSLPMTPPGQSPRSVSSPITTPGGRQLVGGDRRGSFPAFHTAPTSPSSPSPSSNAGTPVISTAVRFDPGARRGSSPAFGQLMGSQMHRTGSAGAGGERRGSQLRVCNLTEEERNHGQAF